MSNNQPKRLAPIRGLSNQKQFYSQQILRKTKVMQTMEQETQKLQEKLQKLKESMNKEKMERSVCESETSEKRWKPKETQKKSNIRRPSSGSISSKQRVPSAKGFGISGFMNEIGLEQYIDKLKQAGFDEMEILLEIQQEHLEQLGIPKGHQLKLLKKIQERKAQNQTNNSQQGEEEEEEEEEIVYVKVSKYVELEPPEFDESFTQQARQSQMRLGDGSYNEQEQQKLFQEAVQDYREQKQLKSSIKSNENTEKKRRNSKSVSFQRDNNKSIIQELEDLSVYFKEQDEQVRQSYAGSQDPEVLRVQKYSCWNCYKLWEKDYLTVKDKVFCSIGCFTKFQELFMSICYHCGKTLLKQDGICVYGVYLCSDECAKEYDFEVMKTNKDEMKQCFNIKDQDEIDKQEEEKGSEIVDLDFESVELYKS